MVSLFTDFLEDIGVIDIRDIEPEEIRVLCEDPVFRKIADYCVDSRRDAGARAANSFDSDELGIDPEEDADAIVHFS